MAGKKSRERSIPTEYYFYRNIGSHGYFSSLSSCEDSFARFYRNLPCNSSRANPFPLRWKLSRVHPSTTRERDEDEDDSSLSLPLPSSPALSLSFPAGGKFGESRKRATLNGANRRCRAAKGCRLKGKQFSWKQLTADWRERRRGEGGEGGLAGETSDDRCTRRCHERAKLHLSDDENRILREHGAAGGPRGRELLKHSFPDQEFVFLVTMPSYTASFPLWSTVSTPFPWTTNPENHQPDQPRPPPPAILRNVS